MTEILVCYTVKFPQLFILDAKLRQATVLLQFQLDFTLLLQDNLKVIALSRANETKTAHCFVRSRANFTLLLQNNLKVIALSRANETKTAHCFVRSRANFTLLLQNNLKVIALSRAATEMVGRKRLIILDILSRILQQ
jgi:peroxiredoxin